MSEPQHNDPNPSGNGKTASFLRRLAHLVRRGHGANGIRESLEEVIEESDRQSTELSPQERRMLSNLLKFGELRVGDVMVPRADIVAVEEQTSLRELIESLRKEQHSRLPIYRETLDDPIGLVHVKDLLSLVEIGEDGAMRWPDVPISKIRRNILFVPASMPALDLLLQMQTTHMHLALVIDEYGGTDGLVSIEDLVEEIVGDIDDEHDVAEAPLLKALPDSGWEADARLDLDDFREQTGLELGPEGEDEEVDTLGGLVVSLLGRLPQRGEIVPHPSGIEFEVLEADPRRVKRLRLRRSQTEPATKSAPES
ncbi:MAG TPA: hemolysin family protein [Rhizomicrobium sp.]|jgi:CBS domain containing-hemolysin-like protein|nr:hemolysin family protein [Rhizomicrobium sp.]